MMWIILLGMALLVLSVTFKPRCYTWALLYTGLNGLWLCEYQNNQYRGWLALDQVAISNRAGQSLLCVILVMILLGQVLTYRTTILVRNLKTLLNGFGLLYAAMVMEQQVFRSQGILDSLGMISNPSHMVCVLALLAPMFRLKEDGKVMPGAIAFEWALFMNILLAQAALPCLVLMVGALAYHSHQKNWLAVEVLSPIFALVLGVAWWIFPHADNGRFKVWGFMMRFWHERASHWFGFGLGTQELFAPAVQNAHNFMKGSWFIWMHNDWLQILFELGIVGLALWAWVAWDILRDAYKQKSSAVFASLVSLCFMMCFNFPLHQPESVFFGLLLVSLV